jgi:transcriptional regulator with XRE-family HTH domain
MTTKIQPITRLEAIRRSRGISQRKLAKLSHIDVSNIWRLEHYGQRAHYATLAALAGPLGVEDPEDLRGYIGDDAAA